MDLLVDAAQVLRYFDNFVYDRLEPKRSRLPALFHKHLRRTCMGYKAVIFDLDGTLLDTLDDLAESGNRVLAAQGMPTHPREAYCYFVGDGLEMLIRRIVPEDRRDEETIRRLIQEFREVYSRNWNVLSRPYPGVDDMLEELRRLGLSLAVLSNKPDDFTRHCVQELLGNHSFVSVLGHRPGVPRKPAPDGALEIAETMGLTPADILYLGDTATDMETALRAGMTPVGALWGFRTADELRQSGAAHLVSHPGEVVELVRDKTASVQD
ncbi:HAD family hydrolase [Desulfolithobacter dissulfuricans]|nr:HAD family hydrolase [Desulfolithobacter dissulfuricans]